MSHTHEHLDSGDTEHYTPEYIIAAVRATMGAIDLDPASSVVANQVVGATLIFTKEDNGLEMDWFGRLFLNHPFSRGEDACRPECKRITCRKRGYHVSERVPSNAEWIDKLVVSYRLGMVEEACCITWANMPENWMVALLPFPQCFPHKRVNYRSADGIVRKGAPKGSVITYLGPNVERFAEAFRGIGTVKVAL